MIDIRCLSTQKSEPSSHQNVLYGICTMVVMWIKHNGKGNIFVAYESFCDSIHVRCGTRVLWIWFMLCLYFFLWWTGYVLISCSLLVINRQFDRIFSKLDDSFSIFQWDGHIKYPQSITDLRSEHLHCNVESHKWTWCSTRKTFSKILTDSLDISFQRFLCFMANFHNI